MNAGTLTLTIWLDANNTLSVPWWAYGLLITTFVFLKVIPAFEKVALKINTEMERQKK